MRVNKEKLAEYLIQKKLILDSSSLSVDMKEAGRGAFNTNYIVEAGKQGRFLFRFVLHSMRPQIEEMAEYEGQILKTLQPLALSPKLILLDKTRNFFSYSLIVEEYIEGKTMKQRGDYVDQVLESFPTVVTLHQQGNAQGLLKQTEIISQELLTQRFESLQKSGSPFATLLLENMASIGQFVNYCNDALQGQAFVHGDLNPENYIFSDSGKWYLVDWQSPFLGDAAYDIATLVWDFYWKFFIGKPLDDAQKDLILQRYAELSGIDVSELKRKVEIVTVFLDLDMLTRIETLYIQLGSEDNVLKLEIDDRDFILQQRCAPARNLLVSEESLRNILKRAEALNAQSKK